MPVAIECPKCGTIYKMPEDSLGRKARCKKCGATFAAQASASDTNRPGAVADTGPSLRSAADSTLPERIGRFEIRAKLGSGAFGTVYRAYDPILEREVALKVPNPGLLTDDQDKQRYLREPKAAAQLYHPNIVPVFEASLDGDNFFIASAYIEGQTLEKALDEERPDFRRATTLVMKLAGALQYAHEHGIVHRDVKPANIMLNTKGEPLLMDFGLARIQESAEKLTHDNAVLGTPAYMSPEQAAGKQAEVGPASDQYSLGVVLYELLCGQRPFSGPATLVVSLVIKQEPPRPRTINPQVPRDLETICLKAMVKEPGKRFADCQEFAEDLQRWLNDQPIRSRRTTIWERGLRWCRRNPVVAGLSVAVFAAILMGGGVATAFGLIARQRAAALDTALSDVGREKDRAFRHLYIAQMNLAQREWKEGSGTALQDRLERLRPEYTGGYDLRGFEWHYLNRLYQTKPHILSPPHVGSISIQSVAFSPDGRRVVVGNYDKTVSIWDAETGQELQTLTGHTEPVESVAYSSDGQRIVSGSQDKTVKVWDAQTGQQLRTLTGHSGPVTSVAFCQDSRRIVSGGVTSNNSHGHVKLWDADAYTELRTFRGDNSNIKRVAISPDGQRIVGGSYLGKLTAWDAETGEEVFVLDGHKAEIDGVMFSPDGGRIVSGSRDRTVKVWDSYAGELLLTFIGHRQAIHAVSFSPDGRRIASGGGDGTVKLWDAKTGHELFTLSVYTEIKGQNSEGRLVIAGKLAHGQINCLAFSPNGKQLVTGTGQSLRVWPVDDDQEQRTLKGHLGPVASVRFSPDGRRIVSGSSDASIRVWNAETGQEIHTMKGHEKEVTSVVYSPDGQRIISGSADQSVKVWDAETGQEIRTLKGHTDQVTSVACSLDGRWIVSGSLDRKSILWDVETGQKAPTQREPYRGCFPAITSLAFSPNGNEIAGGGDCVGVWNVHTGKYLYGIQGADLLVRALDFSPDGRKIASGGDDRVIRVDGHEMSSLIELRSHTAPVTSVVFSSDQERLISGSVDATVKVWDAESGQELLTLESHAGEVTSVAISPDSRRIVAGCKDATIRIWDAMSEGAK